LKSASGAQGGRPVIAGYIAYNAFSNGCQAKIRSSRSIKIIRRRRAHQAVQEAKLRISHCLHTCRMFNSKAKFQGFCRNLVLINWSRTSFCFQRVGGVKVFVFLWLLSSYKIFRDGTNDILLSSVISPLCGK
jgi:hypothetical protein